jgi:hypothetical protein
MTSRSFKNQPKTENNDIDEIKNETNENKKSLVVPTFVEYIAKIEQYLTNHDKVFYIEFTWKNPLQVQIKDIFYIKKVVADEEETTFLAKFKNTQHWIYSTKSIGLKETSYIVKQKGKETKYRYTYYDSTLKPLHNLPLEVFE